MFYKIAAILLAIILLTVSGYLGYAAETEAELLLGCIAGFFIGYAGGRVCAELWLMGDN